MTRNSKDRNEIVLTRILKCPYTYKISDGRSRKNYLWCLDVSIAEISHNFVDIDKL